MVRGEIKTRCPKCQKQFTALDIEWKCTTASAPVTCPYCGHRFPPRVCIEDTVTKIISKIWHRLQ